jgi:hypothetical protein
MNIAAAEKLNKTRNCKNFPFIKLIENAPKKIK